MADALRCCRLPTHQITKTQEPAMNTQTRIPTTPANSRQSARSIARPASYRDAPRNRDFGVGYGNSSGYASGKHYARSEEHTSELQTLMRISYAVFCLKKKKIDMSNTTGS